MSISLRRTWEFIQIFHFSLLLDLTMWHCKNVQCCYYWPTAWLYNRGHWTEFNTITHTHYGINTEAVSEIVEAIIKQTTKQRWSMTFRQNCLAYSINQRNGLFQYLEYIIFVSCFLSSNDFPVCWAKIVASNKKIIMFQVRSMFTLTMPTHFHSSNQIRSYAIPRK